MPLARAAEYGFLSARCHSIRAQLISYENLKELSISRTMGELYSALESTSYAPFLTTASEEGIHNALNKAFEYQRKRVIREVKKENRAIFQLFFEAKYTLLDEKKNQSQIKNPEESFRKIDKDYISSIKKSMLKLSGVEQRHLKKILGSYFDLLNLYNLVKFRILYELTLEETLTYMFPYAENFNINDLSLLCDVKNIQQLSHRIEHIVGESFDSYESFRRVLYRYHRKKLLSIWSGYPFTIAIPFSLLRLIEIEISDIKTITEGIMFKLDSHEIGKMIVGG